MADGLNQSDQILIHKAAQKALGEMNPRREVKDAVVTYLSIRKSGEDEEHARPIFLKELRDVFAKKKSEDEINTLYQAALRTGERLWFDAFMERIY